MAIVEWNEMYATGIPQVDEQHKTLFKAVNEFHEGLALGKGREEMERTLDFLVSYTLNHFKTEEDFMQKHRFEGLSTHRFEHLQLMQEVMNFKERWTKDPSAVRPMEVARFLGQWLVHHTQDMDFRYVQFLKEKGISFDSI
jgi:hemerythrin